MTEIGMMSHDLRPRFAWIERPIRQLEPADDSILETPSDEILNRRREQVILLLENGRHRLKMPINRLAVRINDRHKRVDVTGRRRRHVGTADDLTTAAPDDERANHLYIADEPYMRHGEWQDELGNGSEETAVDVDDGLDTSYARYVDHLTSGGEIDVGSFDHLSWNAGNYDARVFGPGVVYSTDSAYHRDAIRG